MGADAHAVVIQFGRRADSKSFVGVEVESGNPRAFPASLDPLMRRAVGPNVALLSINTDGNDKRDADAYQVGTHDSRAPARVENRPQHCVSRSAASIRDVT